MKTNRLIQISANAIALTLFAAAIGCGRGQNPQAQLALLAGALPISLVGSYHGHLADKTEPYARMRDAAALEAYAGQLAAAIEIPAMPAPMGLPPMLPAASAPITEPEYFDWHLIQTKPDKYAHLAIVGGTGDGKSTLVQSLLQFLGEKAIAIDPHWQPSNYPGIPTVAKGRNYGEYPADPIAFDDLIAGVDCSYTEAIATIHKEMDRRYKLLRSGQPVGDRYSFILDEYTTFAGTHPKCSGDEVLSLIREARKVGLRLILLVQSDLLKDFKWEGQGAARKSLRWCRLGDFARDFASASKDDSLVEWVGAQAYPILVDKSPAVLPVPIAKMRVNSHISESQKQATSHSKTNSNPVKTESDIIKNYLDRLYRLPGYNPPQNNLKQGENQGENFSPCGESENGGENAETNTEREFSPCSESENEGETTPEPGNLESLGESENGFTLDEAGQVLAVRKSGKNKPEIIATVWGVKPGKSRKYESAKAKFEAIQAYWESLNLWV